MRMCSYPEVGLCVEPGRDEPLPIGAPAARRYALGVVPNCADARPVLQRHANP
jgi:hypothetical protein